MLQRKVDQSSFLMPIILAAIILSCVHHAPCQANPSPSTSPLSSSSISLPSVGELLDHAKSFALESRHQKGKESASGEWIEHQNYIVAQRQTEKKDNTISDNIKRAAALRQKNYYSEANGVLKHLGDGGSKFRVLYEENMRFWGDMGVEDAWVNYIRTTTGIYLDSEIDR